MEITSTKVVQIFINLWPNRLASDNRPVNKVTASRNRTPLGPHSRRYPLSQVSTSMWLASRLSVGLREMSVHGGSSVQIDGYFSIVPKSKRDSAIFEETKALFRPGAGRGTKLDVFQTRQCPEQSMFTNS